MIIETHPKFELSEYRFTVRIATNSFQQSKNNNKILNPNWVERNETTSIDFSRLRRKHYINRKLFLKILYSYGKKLAYEC